MREKILRSKFVYIGSLFLLLLTSLIYLPSLHFINGLQSLLNPIYFNNHSDADFFSIVALYIIDGKQILFNSLLNFHQINPAFLGKDFLYSYSNIIVFENTLAHILNSVLVFLLCYRLCLNFCFSQKRLYWFSLVGASLWALHPSHTTMVLNAFQQGSQWDSSFILLGIIIYLIGRQLVNKKLTQGYWIVSVGVIICLLLSLSNSTLSILLLCYIFILEFFLLSVINPIKPTKFFSQKIVLLSISTFLVVYFFSIEMVTYHNGEHSFINDILFVTGHSIHSIINFFFPFLDNLPETLIDSKKPQLYVVLFSMLFGLSIVLMAIVKQKHPLIFFAIAWVLVGHIMGSLVSYYEQEAINHIYLSTLGLSISISYLMVSVKTSNLTIAYAMSFVLVLILLLLTLKSNLAWEANNREESSLEEYLIMIDDKKNEKVKPVYNVSSIEEKSLPLISLEMYSDNSSLNILSYSNPHMVNIQPYLRLLEKLTSLCEGKVDFVQLSVFFHSVASWKNMKLPSVSISAIDDLIQDWRINACNALSYNKLIYFLKKLTQGQREQAYKDFFYTVHFLLGEMYKIKQDASLVLFHFKKAYELKPNLDLLLLQATYLVSKGYFQDANNMLNEISSRANSLRKKFILQLREDDINRLQAIILKKLNRNS